MAKYDRLRKPERDKALRLYAKKHLFMSQREIGLIYGICQQRVSQVLKTVRKEKT